MRYELQATVTCCWKAMLFQKTSAPKDGRGDLQPNVARALNWGRSSSGACSCPDSGPEPA